MNFFNQNKNYKEANLWMESLRVREEQKQNVQTNTVPTESVLAQQVPTAQVNRTIFTQADRGHNQEETNKIQQLYKDLGDLPVIPTFASV